MKRAISDNSSGGAEDRRLSPSLRDVLTIDGIGKSNFGASEVAPSTSGLLARLDAFLPKLAEANNQLASPCKSQKPDVVEKIVSTPTKSALLVERSSTRLSAAPSQPHRRTRNHEHDSIASLRMGVSTAAGLTKSTASADTEGTSDRSLSATPKETIGTRDSSASNIENSHCRERHDETHVVEMDLFVDGSFGELVASNDLPYTRPLIQELPTQKSTAAKSTTPST